MLFLNVSTLNYLFTSTLLQRKELQLKLKFTFIPYKTGFKTLLLNNGIRAPKVSFEYPIEHQTFFIDTNGLLNGDFIFQNIAYIYTLHDMDIRIFSK